MKPSLVIIGLGNPGKAYEQTRHNAGFQVVESLAGHFGQGEWKDAQKFASIMQEARIVAVPLLLVKPQTYMNRSGEAVRKLVDYYKLNPAEQVIVCCDDIDIPLGTFRLKRSGGPGTHNGLKSVVEQFGEGFPRLRIGIGPKPEHADLAAWVLSKMTEEEESSLEKVFGEIPALIKSFVLDKPAA